MSFFTISQEAEMHILFTRTFADGVFTLLVACPMIWILWSQIMGKPLIPRGFWSRRKEMMKCPRCHTRVGANAKLKSAEKEYPWICLTCADDEMQILKGEKSDVDPGLFV